MKVGIFTECYEPVVNGVVHSIQNTRRGLENLGCEVFFFTPDYKERNVKDDHVIPCPGTIIPGASGYQIIHDFPENVKKIAQTMDVFHTQHPFIMAQHILKLRKISPKPLLFTFHCQYEQYAHLAFFLEHQAKKILEHYLKDFCNQCDTIVAPSLSIEKIIESYGAKTPVHLVLNSIDLDIFKKKNLPRPEMFSKLKPDYKKIVLAIRVEKEKNLEFLIRAFRVIFLVHAPAYLIIVGGGTALEYFRNLVLELEIDDRVFFTGQIPYEEVRNYLHHADFFVTASKTEVLPMGLIEAQASGLPIVAVDAVGTRDIVENGKTGYLTKDEMDDFTIKVVRLINSPKEIKKMSTNALRASKNYAIKDCAKEMLKAYQQAIRLHQLKHGRPLDRIKNKL